MSTTTQTAEKRNVIEYLDFPTRTSKRVAWEAWEFTIVGPYQVRVTNASYGYLKDDHAYTVGVENRDGVVVPAECECPADIHHDTDCKHKVALAVVAGSTVLNAAVVFEKPAVGDDSQPVGKGGAELCAGGGVPDDANNECPECTKLSDLPCWPCYQDRGGA